MGRPQRRKTFSMGRLRESTSASSRSRDPTEFRITDIGLITKEPRVDRVSFKIEEGAADLRSIIGTGRAYRHHGAVPERLWEDIARVVHASPSRPDDPCPRFRR
jgi:hypothetical protein